MNAFEVEGYQNENVASLTEKANIFRSVGFADWFVGL